MKKDLMRKTGIDLKRFKRWIKKDIGDKSCGDTFVFDCLNCFAWDLLKKLHGFFWFIEFLDSEEIDKKEIRKHPKKRRGQN